MIIIITLKTRLFGAAHILWRLYKGILRPGSNASVKFPLFLLISWNFIINVCLSGYKYIWWRNIYLRVRFWSMRHFNSFFKQTKLVNREFLERRKMGAYYEYQLVSD